MTSFRDDDRAGARAQTTGLPSVAPRQRARAAANNVVPLHERKTHCPHCFLASRCLPIGLAPAALSHFDQLVGSQRRLRRGAALFHAGDAFQALYSIRVGSLKTSILAEDGREQVAGYHMPGEVIGLDGIAAGHHSCAAVALEDAEVCAIPYDRLEELMAVTPLLQHNLRQLLAREISRNHCLMLLLGSMRAEERVVCFLLDLAERYRERGYSPSEFILRMTREEIGSFLGLKLETVSRVFSRLQVDGLVQAQGRDVKLLDPPALNRLLGREPPAHGD